jgi:hypothetical protein
LRLFYNCDVNRHEEIACRVHLEGGGLETLTNVVSQVDFGVPNTFSLITTLALIFFDFEFHRLGEIPLHILLLGKLEFAVAVEKHFATHLLNADKPMRFVPRKVYCTFHLWFAFFSWSLDKWCSFQKTCEGPTNTGSDGGPLCL